VEEEASAATSGYGRGPRRRDGEPQSCPREDDWGGGLVPSFGPRTIVKELLVGCFYFIFIDRKLEVY
jgi:hypothetical protein